MNKPSVSVDEAIGMVAKLRNTGQIQRAAQVCKRVLLTDPANSDAHFHLGAIKLQVGAFEEAEGHLQSALQGRPRSAVAACALGTAQEMANRIVPAIASFTQAISLDPAAMAAHLGLAAVLCRSGRLDEARAACGQAIKLAPDNPEPNHLMNQILQRCGDLEAAFACHRNALSAGDDVLRCQVIQAVLAKRQAETYLEIGVDSGHNLRLVWAPVKLAVDPVAAAPIVQAQVRGGLADYFEMTSDQFFVENGERLSERPIDVAFIDGLHTYQQTLVDVDNCLQYLAADGVILLHDCNPTTASMAIPATSYEEACLQREAGDNTDWTGDVWKAMVELRSERSDLTARVLNCDYGVGVVVKRESASRLRLETPVAELEYADLEANRDSFLGLCPPSELWAILG